MTEAKASGESPQRIAALAQLEEQYVLYLSGNMLPAFLRTPPPVFMAKPPQQEALRFIAFGDSGAEGDSQLKVAAAMRSQHQQRPFDLGITLGDNFYEFGAATPHDERWVSQWEGMYSPLGIEIYAAMGNHDWVHPDSPAAETIYTLHSKSWRMPATYYSFTAGAVQFFALDTGPGNDGVLLEKELLWLQGVLAASTARWKIVYAHHPLFGASHEVSPAFRDRVLPLLRAGKVDAYLAGHQHLLAHFRSEDGIEFFTAGGGGARNHPLKANDPRPLFAQSVHGFLAVDAGAQEMRYRFIDENGVQLYEYRARKRPELRAAR